VTLPVNSTPIAPEKPDIFFIIVDGYGRTDQLERVMGYSNQGFIEDLGKRGFYTAENARSNYCQTQLSLAATLNLSLLQDYPELFPRASDDRDPLKRAMDKSFASAYLKKLGYATIAVTSGFDEVSFNSADIAYSQPLAMTMLDSALVQLTPVTISDTPGKSQFDARREVLSGAMDTLRYLATPTARPRFIVAHILAPHPPFVFDAGGNPVQQKTPFGFWDGSHYMGLSGTRPLYREGYTGQVQWLNKQLESMVDEILRKESGRDPVIIIEGDHGSKLGMDQEEIEKTDLKECFGNLMAFHVPDRVRAKLYPEITSANTFRVVFDGLFGERLPLLPDRSFYSPFSKPYRFTDVTNRLAG
jgi:hypothetical protein